MKILDWLKVENKQEPAYYRSIEAICYPNKILISTYDQTKTGLGIVTDKISWIGIGASAEKIGQIARKHLSMSQVNVEHPKDFFIIQKAYQKATGLKSTKVQMKDARLVEISEEAGQIVIVPTRNGGTVGDSKGYHHLTTKEIKLKSIISNQQLGEYIKIAWINCE